MRADLDARLQVSSWRTPLSRALSPRTQRRAADAPELTPPPWWQGDEEASQGFLTSMGVNLSG